MHYITTHNMSREQWLKLRQTGLGGTDVAAVLGLSPYKTALDVYLEKTGAKQPPRDNVKMKAGRMLEDVVALWWALENGYKVRRDFKVRFHHKHRCLLANIDRLIVANGSNRGSGVLEVKTTSGFVFKRWEEKGLPPDTYCQIMHYLNVTGHRWGRVAILVDGYDLRDIPVVYDKEYIDLMTRQLLSFWKEHVEKRVPPEPVNEKDIKSLWPKAEDEKVVQADETTLKTVNRLVDVTTQLTDLSAQKKELELQIKLLLKDATILAAGDTRLVTWKQARDSLKFDAAKFREEQPALYEKYSQTSPGSRRFLLKSGS